MEMIKTNHGVNGVLRLTLPEQSAKVHNKKSCCTKGSGKEPVMAIINASNRIAKSMMGFSYFSYFKACYFAGLFRRAKIKPLSLV